MTMFYDNHNNREEFFKLDTVQYIEKTTTPVPIIVMIPSILGPIFCDKEKLHGSCT